MPKIVFDVCVVGSGPGGGIASYVLTQAGLKTVLLEAGPQLRAGVDYGHHRSPMEWLQHGLQRNQWTPEESLFRDRGERNHFTPVGDRPGHGWLKALGGRSLCWAGHSLRFGPLDFRTWPISYEEVAPYYSKAERFMGVYGYKDGLTNMPDGDFLKPVPMRCPDYMLKRGVEKLKAKGRRAEYIAQRKAMATEPHSSGRNLCHYCGKCGNCCVDAKYTSANTPIPRALKTGNLTLLTNATMTRLLLEPDGNRITGVEYRDEADRTQRIECRALVMACNSIETPRHLLANTTRRFPSGLGNGSGQIGKNLTSHFNISVVGWFPELVGRDASNDDGTGYWHGLLTGLYWDEPHPRFERTYQVQVGSGYSPTHLAVTQLPGYGASLKKQLREINSTHALMNMQGVTCISPQKFVDLDPNKTDRFGVPLSRVHLHYEDSDLAMAQDCNDRCTEIIEAAGGKVVSAPGKVRVEDLVIDLNHWVGTVRMGDDPRTAPLDRWGRSHEIPNLFVGDASVFADYPEKNPTLTNITLSWRMSEHLAELARRGELS
ncbi:MAG TPA: GMC family oxidoreductase [Bryobacteraceae bacterium]